MEGKKFRNSPTIIFEKLGAFILFMLFLVFNNLDINDLRASFKSGSLEVEGLLFSAIILVISLVVIVYQFLVWRKTYICINENAIVIERNTIKKKVNTIGIKNISNINIEQGIFEKIMSTYKLKIDTNTATTADETDVEIVLSKEKAIEFKSAVLKKINETKGEEVAEAFIDEEASGKLDYDINYSTLDVIKGSIYNASIISILVLAGVAVAYGIFASTSDVEFDIFSIIYQLIMSLGILTVILQSVVGFFVKYYNFKATRKGDKLYLDYGLIRRNQFSIPVDKINAVNIEQTFISRLLRRYKASITTVGVGDDENESSQITLYDTEEEIKRKLNILLPEIEIIMGSEFQRVPAGSIILSFIRGIFVMGILSVAVYIAHSIIVKFELINLDFRLVMALTIALYVVVVMYYVMKYITAGIYLADDYVYIRDGIYSKKISMIEYKKIQYINIKQGPVSSRLDMSHAEIHILASLLEKDKSITYYSNDIFDKLSKRI